MVKLAWEQSLRRYPVTPRKDPIQSLLHHQQYLLARLLKQIDETNADLGALATSLEKFTTRYAVAKTMPLSTSHYSVVSSDPDQDALEGLVLAMQHKRARKREKHLLTQRQALDEELQRVIHMISLLDADLGQDAAAAAAAAAARPGSIGSSGSGGRPISALRQSRGGVGGAAQSIGRSLQALADLAVSRAGKRYLQRHYQRVGGKHSSSRHRPASASPWYPYTPTVQEGEELLDPASRLLLRELDTLKRDNRNLYTTLKAQAAASLPWVRHTSVYSPVAPAYTVSRPLKWLAGPHPEVQQDTHLTHMYHSSRPLLRGDLSDGSGTSGAGSLGSGGRSRSLEAAIGSHYAGLEEVDSLKREIRVLKQRLEAERSNGYGLLEAAGRGRAHDLEAAHRRIRQLLRG